MKEILVDQGFVPGDVKEIIVGPANDRPGAVKLGNNQSITQEEAEALSLIHISRKQGIKIIAVDTQLKHFKPDASIVSDNYQAGVLIAKELMKRSSNARILLLEHKGTVSADTRIQGFKDTIKGHGSYDGILKSLNPRIC